MVSLLDGGLFARNKEKKSQEEEEDILCAPSVASRVFETNVDELKRGPPVTAEEEEVVLNAFLSHYFCIV